MQESEKYEEGDTHPYVNIHTIHNTILNMTHKRRSGAVVRVSDFGPKWSLVRTPAGAHFVVALSKSHLRPAWYWLNPGSGGRTND